MDEPKKSNVIDFRAKQLAKEIDPLVKEMKEFREFYEDNYSIVEMMVDFLVQRISNEYGYAVCDMNEADYTLVFESVMSMIMRLHGIEHVICQDVADTVFGEDEE